MIEPNVKDIFLRKSILSLNKDLNILQMNGLEFEQQAYNKIASVQVVEIFDDEDRTKVLHHDCFYRLQCGIRLVKSQNDSDTEPSVYFEIQAEYDIVFGATGPVEIEELESFSSSDVISIAAWPYWKEHVASLCSKAGMNALAVQPPNPNEPIKITGKRQL